MNYLAKIAVDKSLLKEFQTEQGRTVYLEDGKEFQIQLWNDQKDDIGIKVYINNKPIKNMLVLRPAERCWLERYTDKAVKFRFTTYTVSGDEKTKEIVSDNGIVKVEFYRKRNYPMISTWGFPITRTHDNWYDPWNRVWNEYTTTTTGGTLDGYCYYSSISSATYSTSLDCNVNTLVGKSIEKETGRIGEGSESDQKFSSVSMEFEDIPFSTEKIKILPVSEKPVQPGDLSKLYCPECGRKINSKFKFCPYCGTEMDSALKE